MHLETVGNCYQLKCCDIFYEKGDRDVEENVIDCTLHSNCKALVQKRIRKGRILHLKDPAVFSIGMHSTKSSLVAMDKCIINVYK
jgi:hypothetical protein